MIVNSDSSNAVDNTFYPNPSKGVSVISSKKIYPTSQQKSNKKSKRNNQEQQEIIYVDKPKEVETVGTKSNCNCQVLLCGSDYQLCRCGPELLWVLFLCLVVSLTLAALIIPIAVGLSGTSPNNQCSMTYSQSFLSSTGTTSQCTAWQTFVSGLTCSTYRKLRIYGSLDQSGITLTDSTAVNAIATALRTSASYTGFSNGYLIRIGTCGIGMTLTVSGGICSCSAGYNISPCWSTGGYYWGGLGTGTVCGATSQTMSVSIE